MSLEEVREYEQTMQEKTNSKVKSSQNNTGEVAAPDPHCTEIPQREGSGDRGRGERMQLDVRAVKVERETWR